MQALQQYIDLYREHREVIHSHSAAPLNALREEALQMIEHNHTRHFVAMCPIYLPSYTSWLATTSIVTIAIVSCPMVYWPALCAIWPKHIPSWYLATMARWPI